MPINEPDALKVLLVEDSYAVAQSFIFLMEDHGWHIVGPAPTITQSIELIEQHPIDVAVLDINLQGSVITPVADLLQNKSIPFVYLTGYANIDDILPDHLKQHPILLKPIDVESLIQTIKQLVGSNSS
ncbi:MAG: response regulator [Phycisphaeraceae bacterium]|nr:response regulator [Phycisphaeraceae bacterium]